MSDALGSQNVWRQALAAVREMSGTLGELRSDYATTLDLLEDALDGVTDRRAALLLLGHLGQDYAIAVADSLVEISMSHRDALLARQILGSLPHDEIARIVPEAVWAQLGKTDDGEAYRRLAELLHHLGLFGSLQELSERALLSSDLDVREVGQEFGR
jgi:hypothetical protein